MPFYFGLTDKHENDTIKECWNSNLDAQLSPELDKAMEAYKASDIATGNKIMLDTKNMWEAAIAGCGEIADYMAEMSKRFKDLH